MLIEMCLAGTVASFQSPDAWLSAVCGGHEMRHGRHYATFNLRSSGWRNREEWEKAFFIGVVGADFTIGAGRGVVSESPQGWLLGTHRDDLICAGRYTREWEGRQAMAEHELREGDTFVRLPLRCPAPPVSCAALTLRVAQGMLLDLDAATLTLWINGERKGVMARPGMTDDRGQPVRRLEGPLRWAVDLDGAVKIERQPLPADA